MKRSNSHPFVLVALSTVQKARRDKLAGIYRAARERAWDLRVVERRPFAPTLSDLVRERLPDGAILDGDEAAGRLPAALLRDLPVVYLDRVPADDGSFSVDHDAAATARLAAEHLTSLGLGNFAYVGTCPPIDWSEARGAAFAELVQRQGGTCAIFDPAPTRARDARHLRAWLKALPRPCGVFAAMDIRARDVLDACADVGLRVPDDLAVLGVDNDELLCENCWPSLSSILPDFQHAGELAVELLDEQMHGRPPARRQLAYGPLRLVVRASTRRLPLPSRSVSAAQEFIRQNACAGIRVEDVVRGMGTARRTAEVAFRRATGTSILDAIQTVRLDAVCALLRDTRTPIALAAASCGYRSDAYLKNLFKQRFGVSMSAYRSSKFKVQGSKFVQP